MDIRRTYTEVFEVLNLLGNEYIQKIPIQLYKHIDNNRDKKSIIEYDINKNILEQDISEDTRNMIAYLNLEYWCTAEEKENLLKQYKEKDNLYEESIKKKYSSNIFLNKKQKNTYQSETVQLIEYIEYKENVLQKFLNKIINWIKWSKK